MQTDKEKNEKSPFWQHYSTSPLQIYNAFYTPSKLLNRFKLFHEVEFFPRKNRWTNHQGFYQNLPNFSLARIRFKLAYYDEEERLDTIHEQFLDNLGQLLQNSRMKMPEDAWNDHGNGRGKL